MSDPVHAKVVQLQNAVSLAQRNPTWARRYVQGCPLEGVGTNEP